MKRTDCLSEQSSSGSPGFAVSGVVTGRGVRILITNRHLPYNFLGSGHERTRTMWRERPQSAMILPGGPIVSGAREGTLPARGKALFIASIHAPKHKHGTHLNQLLSPIFI